MAQVITTTNATDTSGELTPTGETIIQVVGAKPGLTLKISVKADAAAAWTEIKAARPISEPVLRIAQVPFLQLDLSGNEDGNQVDVYTGEI